MFVKKSINLNFTFDWINYAEFRVVTGHMTRSFFFFGIFSFSKNSIFTAKDLENWFIEIFFKKNFESNRGDPWKLFDVRLTYDRILKWPVR